MKKGMAKSEALMLFLMVLGFFFVVMFFQEKLIGLFVVSAEQPKEHKETASPVREIELIELSVPDCNLCLSFERFRNQLRGLDIKLREKVLPYNSDEAKYFIENYNIRAVPTIIIRGDFKGLKIFNNWEDFGTEESDALVFRNRYPVYYDLKEKRFVGAVKLIELRDPSCSVCAELFNVPEVQWVLSNIKVVSIRRIDANTAEGEELIKKHFIDFLPALIFSPEIKDYNTELYSSLGSFSPDGSFIVRKRYAPYKDLSTGAIRGLLSLIMIEASKCWACMDARDMLNYLNSRFGLIFTDLQVFDYNTIAAQMLIKDYGLRYLPAAIIVGDTNSYEIFEHWEKIGGAAFDNAYVLEGYGLLGSGFYYDLNSNAIVRG